MARKSVGIYRMPIATATQVGKIEVIFDRTGRGHIGGVKVVTVTEVGDFLTLTTDKGAMYHVKAAEYDKR